MAGLARLLLGACLAVGAPVLVTCAAPTVASAQEEDSGDDASADEDQPEGKSYLRFLFEALGVKYVIVFLLLSFGLVALLVHSATDFNMHIPANAILAVTLLALLAAHQRFASERYWTGAGRPLCAAVTIVALAGAVFLAAAGSRRAVAYYWTERAARLPSFSPAAVEAWKKAFAAEPKDAEFAYQIGESYRLRSWDGGDNYEELARQAMEWFERGAKLNPYDVHFPLRLGMCLDWLGQRDKSWAYYSRAEELDPNGYFSIAHIGWHFVQIEDYAAARPWFERSLHLKWDDNPIAENYLALCHRRLIEAATNSPAAQLLSLPPSP